MAGLTLPGGAGPIVATGGQTARSIADHLGDSLDVFDFYQTGDGLDLAPAINRAVAACIANKGGVVVVPRVLHEILLGSSVVITPGSYVDGTGITLKLGGNKFYATHTGWAIDAQTNAFVPGLASYQSGQRETVIDGENALIRSTVSNAAGGVRLLDCIGCSVKNLSVWNYVAGYGVQLAVTPGSVVNGTPTRWNEFSLVEHIKVSSCAIGVATECDSPLISFLGTHLRKIAVEGTQNGSILYRFRGGLWNGSCEDIGGYINQSGTSGSVVMVMDGSFQARHFVACWVDAGPDAQGNGGGSSTALTDIVFGPNYTTNAAWFPTFKACALNAPPGWRAKLFAAPGDLIGTQLRYVVGMAREVIRAPRTVYVGLGGSDGSGDGLTAATAFRTLQTALALIYQTLDLASLGAVIQFADGTYPEPQVVQGLPLGLGSASLILQGNPGTANAVRFATTNAHALQLVGGAQISLRGVTVATSSSGRGISVESQSRLTLLDGNQFDACATGHLDGLVKSTVAILSPYKVIGGAPHHWGAYLDSLFEKGAAVDVTNIAFSGNFAEATNGGSILINNGSFSASGCTGSRFYADYGGRIQTYSGNPNSVLPGSANGFANTSQGAVVT